MMSTPGTLANVLSRGQYRLYDHTKVLDQFVMRFLSEEEQLTRGMVFMPPQHGMTEYAIALLTWLIGNRQDLQAGLFSYSMHWSRAVLRKVRADFEECGGDWESSRNRPLALGMGSALTGQAFDFVVVDGPYKNAEEWHSASYTNRLWDWYWGVLQPHLAKGAKVLIFGNGFRKNDFCGSLLCSDIENWEVLNLPAIAPARNQVVRNLRRYYFPDGAGRQIGEALCPEMHSLERLNKTRIQMGEKHFWAYFQGGPDAHRVRPTRVVNGFQELRNKFAVTRAQLYRFGAIPVDGSRGHGRFDSTIVSAQLSWRLDRVVRRQQRRRVKAKVREQVALDKTTRTLRRVDRMCKAWIMRNPIHYHHPDPKIQAFVREREQGFINKARRLLGWVPL